MTPIVQLQDEAIYGRALHYRRMSDDIDLPDQCRPGVYQHRVAFTYAVKQMARCMDDWWLGQVSDTFHRHPGTDVVTVQLDWVRDHLDTRLPLLCGEYSRTPLPHTPTDAQSTLDSAWATFGHHLSDVDYHRGLLYLVKGYLNSLINEHGFTHGFALWHHGALTIGLQCSEHNEEEGELTFTGVINTHTLNDAGVL